MIPATRQELIDYCLRSLGAPVLDINVESTQLEDRIDEAIQFYQEYHSEAIIPTFLKYQIQPIDVTNQYITIPQDMTIVTRVLPFGVSAGAGSNVFDASFRMDLYDAFSSAGGGLSYYVQTKQYIELINSVFSGLERTRFNRHMNRLYIDVDWSKDISENDWLIIDGYKIVDPASYSDVYNDMFLKRYATALIKRQWGQNLSKFEGMVLPGGIQFSGAKLMDDANAEIRQIEEEVQLKFEAPTDFFMG